MFEKIVREFLAIVSHLLKQPNVLIQKNEQLVVPKNVLVELLNHHEYLPAIQKLQSWRSLNWIDCEDNHFRRRVQINGKSIVAIKINLSVFHELIRLRQSDGQKYP